MALRIGTSGWHYADWAGVVYPDGLAKTRWFDHYATRFDTVEINASFYRLPVEKTIQKWRDQAPERFCYAAKGSRFTTHHLKIGGERLEDSVRLVTGRLAGLGDALGVVLWQLPPNLHRDVPRLRRFVGLLPTSMRHAVEFRHASWYEEAVDDALAEAGVARVWVSGLGGPPDTGRSADFVYLRFHGLGADAYRWDYSEAELKPWARAVRRVIAAGNDAFVYFNNDYHGHAVRNANTFAAMVTGADGRRPPPQLGPV